MKTQDTLPTIDQQLDSMLPDWRSLVASLIPHWAVVYLYRDSNPNEIAEEIAEQLADLCSQ